MKLVYEQSIVELISQFNFPYKKVVKKKHENNYIRNITVDDRFPEFKFVSFYKKKRSGLFNNSFEIVYFEIEGVTTAKTKDFNLKDFEKTQWSKIPPEDVKDKHKNIGKILSELRER